jgi:putative CocE/NonD family hydrolase
VDESSDTYDTIDWPIKNVPNNNGKVGIWGISYPGFYTTTGIIDAHPALKAASPQAPIADWFIGDDFHHNGVLYLPHMFRFFGKLRASATAAHPSASARHTAHAAHERERVQLLLRLGPLSAINEKYFKNDVPFWTEMTEHANYDEYWQARDIRRHLKNIKPAVMTVGGWFDAEDLFGALNTYKEIERNNPGEHNTEVGPLVQLRQLTISPHACGKDDDGGKMAQGCGTIYVAYMAARLGEVFFWAGFILAPLWLYLAFNAEEPRGDVALYVMPLFIVFVGWVLRCFLAGPRM